VRSWKKTFHENRNDKKGGIAILILGKTDVKEKAMKKNKEGYYIIIKWSIQKEDFTLINIYASNIEVGFPSGSAGKESVSNAGDVGLIPGSGRYPEEGNGYPLQYSCPENPMDRGAWQATVHRVTKSWTQLKQPSTNIWCHFYKQFITWANNPICMCNQPFSHVWFFVTPTDYNLPEAHIKTSHLPCGLCKVFPNISSVTLI